MPVLLSYRVGLKANRRAVSYTHHSQAFHAGEHILQNRLEFWFKGFMAQQALWCLFPPPAHSAPSGGLTANQHGGSLELNASVFSLYRTTKICGLFHKVNLSFNSGGQPRGLTRVCIA